MGSASISCSLAAELQAVADKEASGRIATASSPDAAAVSCGLAAGLAGRFVSVIVPYSTGVISKQMAKPSPMPPFDRLKPSCAWRNAPNISSNRSCGMPMPVSSMEKR